MSRVKIYLDNDWVEIPQPPMFSDGIVWHYTNQAGFLGVLDSGCLWASSAAMLNDSSELEYGIGKLRELCAEHIEFLRRNQWQNNRLNEDQIVGFLRDVVEQACELLLGNDIYVLCASRKKDDLSQWRGYGDGSGSGYALGLRVEDNLSDPLKILIPEGSDPLLMESHDVWPQWMSVLYDPAEQDALLRSLMTFLDRYAKSSWNNPDRELAMLQCAGFISTVLVCVKNPGFSAEEEVRYAFTPHPKRTDLINIRPTQVGPCPYLKVTASEDKFEPSGSYSVTTPHVGGLPIHEVMVGPGPTQSTALRGAARALVVHKYLRVDVTPSEVPYR